MKIEERWKNHKTPRENLVKQIIIRRQPETKDHSDNPIVNYPSPQVNKVDLPMANHGKTWAAFRKAAASVSAWLDRELNDRLDAWNKSRNGLAPTRESVEKDLLGGRTPSGADGAKSYLMLYRSSTYPALTRLCDEGHIRRKHLMAPYVNSIALNITQSLTATKTQGESPGMSGDESLDQSYNRHAALEECEKSPFWKHLDLLRQDSPKYQHVATRIREMFKQNKPQEPKEHMVLFAMHPVSCLITTMLLLNDFPDLRIRYIHASMPFQANGSNHSRQAMIEALDDHDHHQVFILTYDLGSVGLNLQQANHLIQLEEASNHADATQAPARVHRRGQIRKTHLECLHDPRNIGEKSTVDKNKNRGAMSRLDFSEYTDPQSSQESG
ncbi:hypothetical protein PG988_003821 [Apiospora saccharicola]